MPIVVLTCNTVGLKGPKVDLCVALSQVRRAFSAREPHGRASGALPVCVAGGGGHGVALGSEIQNRAL